MDILKYFFMLFSCFTLLKGNTQNLVINPSFEEYRELPYLYSTIDSFFCKGWYIPSESSPDYYHKNSHIPKLGIPDNIFGRHPARTGNAYIGIIPLVWDGYMEHITGSLTTPLIKDQKYKISFYIRFAGNTCFFYASNIGIHLSETRFPLFNYSMPFYDELLKPEIKSDIKEEKFIKDTSWQLIERFYEAKGNEKYFTIGIFYESNWHMENKKNYFIRLKLDKKKKSKFYKKNQDILKINPNHILNPNFQDELPYYFIDDITIELDTLNYQRRLNE